ncbi:MAG: glycogen-binding domain-containing protein [Treponema sp.]|jgi:hypothetical protein|nr:glycogen-binding domain-containing protein [Treponema sp.]
MKKFFIVIITLLMAIIGTIGADDSDSYRFVDHLLRRSGPGKPEIVADSVVFTAPSSYRRVGIAFGHEGFGKIYWFRKLMIPNEEASPWIKDKPPPDMFRDSGMLFHVFPIPETLDRGELEYRLIIDGLWVRDPLNPDYKTDTSGISKSVVSIPRIKRPDSPSRGPGGTLTFTFYAESGETVSVAGSFNNWDPFMYELPETSPGRYTLSLPLPPGVYQYAFFHRGERFLDPSNPRRVYSRDGKAASEAAVD